MQPPQIDAKTVLLELSEALRSGKEKNLSKFLWLFKVEGKTMTLGHHFQFEPVFNTTLAKRTLLMCARQLGKSYSICANNLLQGLAIPNYRSLFVLPRQEQAKRLSVDIVRPYIQTSPFKDLFVNSSCDDSIFRRTFKNESLQYFSYALLDADKMRGISGVSSCIVDEVQDVIWDFIPIIGETMSAVIDYGFFTFSGTPKTLDNTMAALWEDSSQAEWITKCDHCGFYNIPDIDHHIIKMIGKDTVICAKCEQHLDCSKGAWVHKYKERRHMFAGYHLSQIIHPVHYKYPAKWQELRNKMNVYGKSKFYNEVLGIPCDSNEKLMTQTTLQEICCGSNNSLQDAIAHNHEYDIRTIGIDWGGGGEDSESYTCVALGGRRRGTDLIECAYITKFKNDLDQFVELKELLEIIKKWNPQWVAHDYGGAGAQREQLLLQAGVPIEKMAPFTYVTAANKPIINYNPPANGYRQSWSLDKPRSILVLCTMMKARKLKFPAWDYCEKINSNLLNVSLMSDFLNIAIERVELPTKSDALRIAKTPKKSDDAVHAVNYMASAIWNSQGRYPDVAEAMQLKNIIDNIKNKVKLKP